MVMAAGMATAIDTHGDEARDFDGKAYDEDEDEDQDGAFDLVVTRPAADTARPFRWRTKYNPAAFNQPGPLFL
jgi:hypothetical protein